MTYFLPSYFQKRLLRYALTRLDFIETDALNLEDLDITFGQRSVVELKNVGIKVQKLIESLQLPSNLVLEHALTRQLRITVPADLHVSGIIVEVDGVDIQVRLQEQQDVPDKFSSSAPNRKDVANRPRLTSTSLHDPGGSERARTGQLDTGHVIPTSQDLAVSFLQTEPREEREELEAVLHSQSQYVQDSTASLDSTVDESGIGMPGGFSLPGFVANFFAGVADRLTVTIKNIEVTAGVHLPSDGSPAETVKLMLRLRELSLAGMSTNPGSTNQRRSISLLGFELLLLSEPEAFSQHSTSSSPRLTRSRSKASSAFGSENLSQADSPLGHSTDVRFQPTLVPGVARSLPHLDSSLSHSSISSQFADLRTDEDRLALERLQDAPEIKPCVSASELYHSDGDQASPLIDNREHAEKLVGSRVGQSVDLNEGSSFHTEKQGAPEDLTESRMFTHDQAESMYMSAISTGFETHGMPGAWETSHSDVSGPSQDLGAQGEKSTTAVRTDTSSSGSPLGSRIAAFEQRPQSGNGSTELFSREADQLNSRRSASFANLVAKCLVKVDQLTLTIPASVVSPDQDSVNPSKATAYSSPKASRPQPGSRTASFETRPSSTIPGNEDMAASYLKQSSHTRNVSRDFIVMPVECHYDIGVGQASVALDMSIGRILVKATPTLNRILMGSDKKSKSSSASFNASLRVQVGSIHVKFCQSVPEASHYSSNEPSDSDRHPGLSSQPPLLQLSISGVQHEYAQTTNETRQKLTIEKISLGQSWGKVLYFVESINMRDSVTTSVLIRPHDLVVTNSNDRYDIQLKPVTISLDLLLVDDVLSRGGGLSSLLDLGNSIMSTGTVKESSANVHTLPSKQRLVRFDNNLPKPNPDSESPGMGPKIDVRIAGAFLELLGSETSVQLRTSAIKLVARQKIFRAQIDNVALLGPLIHETRANADINVKVANLSLVYLDSPAEEDLDRLLSLLTPSSDRYDEEDDIMVDTLIRQRRKGGVLRISTNDVQVNVRGISWHKHVSRLGDELSKLSAVSKYLPEDDRPGVLSFGLVNKLSLKADLGGEFGVLHLKATLLEGAHINVPGLMAAQLSTISLERDENLILGEVILNLQDTTLMGPPMLMCRFIADEMEPMVRVKLSNTQIEYTVPTLMAVMSLADSLDTKSDSKESRPSPRSSELSSHPSDMSDFARKVRFSLSVRNTAIALNPDKSPAKGLLLLSDANLTYGSKQAASTLHFDLRKASILIIDDAGKIGHGLANADHKLYFEENDQVQDLTKAGYVPVGSVSNASAIVNIVEDKANENPVVDVEFRNNLFLLETCADSTQTLIQILSGLAPPSIPSTQLKYRTEIVPIQDMLASFTGNAFVSEPGPEMGMQASHMTTTTVGTTTGQDRSDNGDEDSESDDAYSEDEDHDTYLEDSYMESDMSQSIMSDSVHVAPVNITADEEPEMGESIMAHSMLDFRTDHFVNKTTVEGTAHRWDSTRNTYGLGSERNVLKAPLKVRVRDVHIIWNLFDGYDWQGTRDTISVAVQEIETRAMSRNSHQDSRRSPGGEEDESVIGDFLFNSIYIGVPASKDPKELTNAINQEIGDLVSETGSYATGTTVTAIPSGRAATQRPRQKKLRLNRSRQHKMTFELKGVSADLLAFPPGSGEVESSVDVRVNVLEVFDHVPTSTWKKFATYMHEAGEREVNTSMVHIELLNVKPIAELAASEMVLKLTVLPLRLHVDQDALDFMTRFFEFKDDKAPVSTTPSAPPFFQRVEVNPIKLKLDFKPKRVDYGGLRSGRTTEFMNFFVLDRADMVLRRVILYGVSGLDRVGIMLNNIWSPDVRRNQLPGVLAGLAPIRPLVDVGSGIRDLVAVPIREYRKDGRIVRSIQKGALAFAKTTTTELVNLGAKLAIGTQTVLQNTEDMLVQRPEADGDDEPKEQISLYADQPLGIVQGLRGAYASLERDLLLAKDAIVAVPGEVMASGSATGAAKAVLRQSPTIILRPAIGASKAVGQTLLGAGNTLDRGNLRRVGEKYKRHF